MRSLKLRQKIRRDDLQLPVRIAPRDQHRPRTRVHGNGIRLLHGRNDTDDPRSGRVGQIGYLELIGGSQRDIEPAAFGVVGESVRFAGRLDSGDVGDIRINALNQYCAPVGVRERGEIVDSPTAWVSLVPSSFRATSRRLDPS